MRCVKCQGLVVNEYGDVRCLNCGRRYFPPEPVSVLDQIQATILARLASRAEMRRTHASRNV